MRRVAITGLGMCAPTGIGVSKAWQATIEARSGIRKVKSFDSSNLSVQIAGEVENLDPLVALDPKEARRATRFVALAAVAAKEAMSDAGLGNEPKDMAGTAIGVGIGGMQSIEETAFGLYSGAKKVSPFFIPYTIPNMASGVVSMNHGLLGPNICPATACASGTHAIGESFLYIRQGLADIMVCGGAESTVSPLGLNAFIALKALSTGNTDPESASRPFDLERDGFVMGEGAGILVLEELEAAKKRGAHIYGEIIGFGLSGDAYHLTAPAPQGAGGYRAMKGALDSAQINPEEVDYINAHGTSTKLNDQLESEAIMQLFGHHAQKISISSTKGVTGHCLGAAGGIEAVFTALAIKHSIVPPTANLRTPDPACPLDYTPLKARPKAIKYAISNSFGFGGTNACIAIKRFD